MEIKKGTYENIVNIISTAQYEIIAVLPNISIEIAHAFEITKRKNIKVSIYVDFRETTYREGFGDIQAIDILKQNNVNVNKIEQCNLSIIILDNIGYFYFPKSRFFEKEGINYDLISMSSNQIQFFKEIFSFNRPLPNNPMHPKVSPIQDTEYKQVKENIESNPPLRPLLKRTLNTYTSKFKIVELKCSGFNLHISKIKLPKNALPFNDSELQRSIESTLRLFTNIPEKEFFEPFFKLKNEVTIIRTEYLHHIKCRKKNLIKIEEIVEFKKKIDQLIAHSIKIKDTLLNDLQKEINQTKERIINSMIDFAMNNTPEEYIGLDDDLIKSGVKEKATLMLGGRFPSAKDLLKSLEIDYKFYDLTWEDLNNKEILEEMSTVGLINANDSATIKKVAIEVESEISNLKLL